MPANARFAVCDNVRDENHRRVKLFQPHTDRRRIELEAFIGERNPLRSWAAEPAATGNEVAP